MTLEAFTGGEVSGKDWGQGGASVAGRASGKAGHRERPEWVAPRRDTIIAGINL